MINRGINNNISLAVGTTPIDSSENSYGNHYVPFILYIGRMVQLKYNILNSQSGRILSLVVLRMLSSWQERSRRKAQPGREARLTGDEMFKDCSRICHSF